MTFANHLAQSFPEGRKCSLMLLPLLPDSASPRREASQRTTKCGGGRAVHTDPTGNACTKRPPSAYNTNTENASSLKHLISCSISFLSKLIYRVCSLRWDRNQRDWSSEGALGREGTGSLPWVGGGRVLSMGDCCRSYTWHQISQCKGGVWLKPSFAP